MRGSFLGEICGYFSFLKESINFSRKNEPQENKPPVDPTAYGSVVVNKKLARMDSNHEQRLQRPLCYHYTTSQYKYFQFNNLQISVLSVS